MEFAFGILDSEFGVLFLMLGFGFRLLGCGFSVFDFGFGMLGFGFGFLDFGFGATVDGRKNQTTSINILFGRIKQGVNYMADFCLVALCMLAALIQHDPHRNLRASFRYTCN